ncbi:MAG: hypothetical protein GF350_07100 [Chitinivibrionales bacterium]|nr:hypothetical protein [Chitinivibrionales bacterium]
MFRWKTEPLHLISAFLGGMVLLFIIAPLAWRGVLSGLILMWARGMSEFGAVLIITSLPMITAILIYECFGAFGLQYARPVSVLFIAVCLVIFVMFQILSLR